MLLGILLLALDGLVLLAAVGTTHEDVVKGMLTALDDVNKVLADVKDEPTAVAARPELRKLGQRLAELRKQAKALPQPTKEEKDQLERAYKGKFDEVLKKQSLESLRVKGVRGGPETLKEIAVLDEKKKAKE